MMTNPSSADLSPQAPVRLLLIDAHDRSRRSSRALLDANPRFSVVGESSKVEEGLRFANELAPDVVILSMRVDGSTGPDVARLLLESHPNLKVLFLTLFEGQEYVDAAKATGAHGYALKQAPAEELFAAIDAVLHGETVWATGQSRPDEKL